MTISNNGGNMKQEIVCNNCKEELRKLFPVDEPSPGEYVKFVEGKARTNYICDQCGRPIKLGEICLAFSSWADYGGVPYYKWEYQYLVP